MVLDQQCNIFSFTSFPLSIVKLFVMEEKVLDRASWTLYSLHQKLMDRINKWEKVLFLLTVNEIEIFFQLCM